jgi:transposase
VSDDEWAVVAPYLTLMTAEAPQRVHSLRAVVTGLRWLVRAGAPWRLMPNDLPPWEAVYQQTQRWLTAGVCAASVPDWRVLLRLAEGRREQPSAAMLDRRTLPSTPESGARAGDDGAQRQRGSQGHRAVDTPGHLLAWPSTAAHAQDRAQVARWAGQVQEVTGDAVESAVADQGYTGAQPAQDAAVHGLHLEVVKLPEAKQGFVLLPRRWVVERRFAWTARFRRLARDDERLPATLAGLHLLIFVLLMLKRFVELMT